jgi:hypothetical protein
MGTSAPKTKEHDIDIVERPKKPMYLPAPDPDKYVTPGVPVPQHVPDKVKVNGQL